MNPVKGITMVQPLYSQPPPAGLPFQTQQTAHPESPPPEPAQPLQTTTISSDYFQRNYGSFVQFFLNPHESPGRGVYYNGIAFFRMIGQIILSPENPQRAELIALAGKLEDNNDTCIGSEDFNAFVKLLNGAGFLPVSSSDFSFYQNHILTALTADNPEDRDSSRKILGAMGALVVFSDEK